jgi:hypothetical protein
MVSFPSDVSPDFGEGHNLFGVITPYKQVSHQDALPLNLAILRIHAEATLDRGEKQSSIRSRISTALGEDCDRATA